MIVENLDSAVMAMLAFVTDGIEIEDTSQLDFSGDTDRYTQDR
jgi:hypothetical protein